MCIRAALQRLQQENQLLKENQGLRPAGDKHRSLNYEEDEEEEEEEDLEEDEAEEDGEEETASVSVGKRGHPFNLSEERGKRHCTGPRSLDLPHQYTHQPETVTHTYISRT